MKGHLEHQHYPKNASLAQTLQSPLMTIKGFAGATINGMPKNFIGNRSGIMPVRYHHMGK